MPRLDMPPEGGDCKNEADAGKHCEYSVEGRHPDAPRLLKLGVAKCLQQPGVGIEDPVVRVRDTTMYPRRRGRKEDDVPSEGENKGWINSSPVAAQFSCHPTPGTVSQVSSHSPDDQTAYLVRSSLPQREIDPGREQSRDMQSTEFMTTAL